MSDTVLLRTLGTGGLEEVAAAGGGTDKHSIRRLNKPSKVAPGDEDNKAMCVSRPPRRRSRWRM